MRLSLEANPAFKVIVFNGLDTAGKELSGEQELFLLQPDVVIFDTSSVQPQFRYNLIQTQLALQLIGVDPDRDQALVWSGQHLLELSLQDLVDVIARARQGDPVSLKNHSASELIQNTDTKTRGPKDTEDLSPYLPIT